MNLHPTEAYKSYLMGPDNEKGFTLVEMLMVLCVWSVLIGLTVSLSPSLFQSQKEKAFMKQFRADVLWAQQQTMTTREYFSVLFVPEENEYRILKNRFQILATRDLPEEWDVQFSYSLDRHIQFHASGLILQAGSLQIKTPRNTYKVVFPLGKARFYVQEQ